MIATSATSRSTEFGLQTCSTAWLFLSARSPDSEYAIGFIGCKNLEERAYQKMANRKGVFIGAYVPNHLKESLRRRAAAEHRTLSQEITRILEEAVHGKGLPPGSIDRRTKETQPRRRSSDPAPRRRANDIPYSGGNKSGDDSR